MAVDGTPASQAEWVAKVRGLRTGGNLTAALEACAAGLQAFPESMDLLFSYGEVNIEMFNQAKNPELLKAALICFERLLKINPRHYMANLLATRIYLKGKALSRAEEKLSVILKMSPGDPRAVELKTALDKAKAQQKALQQKAQPSAPASQAAAPPAKDETADEKEEYGSEGLKAETVEGLMAAGGTEQEMLINRLSLFKNMEGVRSIHLIDPLGVEIKSVIKVGGGLDKFSSHISDIFRTSGLCARKSGMGNFQRGTVMAPGAVLMLANVFYGILVLVLDPDADLKNAEGRIVRYVGAIAE